MNPRNFFAELKRRNVYKVAIAYGVVGWLLIQISTSTFPVLEIPNWAIKLVIVLVVLAFPVALVLAWAFELTPEGIKRAEDVIPNESITHKTGRKLTAVILVVALIAACLLVFRMVGTDRRAVQSAPARGDVIGRSAASLPEKSIAVLPFKSLSEDKANNYFADGIQDEILARLAKIAELKVISRTSTQKYQSSPDNLREIAQQLGVTNILEGSVQKAADQVRITVQLINATTDAHLWAETYDRKLTDIFGVESEVAERIANSLEARLTGREKERLAEVPTQNPQAYDAYLRGISFISGQGNEPRNKAIQFFRQAVALDPAYAQAWAQLSVAESEKYFADEHTQAQLQRARETAETSVRLQPELGDAHLALGSFYYYCLQDFDRALAELDEARKHSLNNGRVIFTIGMVKRRQGKIDESIEFQKKGTVLDPRNSDYWTNMGRTYRGKRDFKTAREMFDRAYAVSPEEKSFLGEKAETYTAEGDLEAAESVLREQELKGSIFFNTVELLYYRGRFKEAITALSGRIEANPISPVAAADRKSWIGELTLLSGDVTSGQRILEESRKELLALRASGDTSLRVSDALLLTTARLGHRQEVEQEAAQLLSATQHDLWRAPRSEEQVARAYAILGDADRAIPLLAHALSVPYQPAITPALLRLDPVWNRIHNDPRFQKLCEQKKP